MVQPLSLALLAHVILNFFYIGIPKPDGQGGVCKCRVYLHIAKTRCTYNSAPITVQEYISLFQIIQEKKEMLEKIFLN